MLETAQSKSPEVVQPHCFQGETEVKTQEMTYSESIAKLVAEPRPAHKVPSSTSISSCGRGQ